MTNSSSKTSKKNRRAAPGHIEKRGNSYRAINYVFGIRESETFASRSEAAVWLTQRESDSRTGTIRARLLGEATTLREAVGRYLLEVTPSKKSAASEISQARRLLLHLGPVADYPMADIKTIDLADYIQRRTKMPSKRAGTNPKHRLPIVSASTCSKEIGFLSAVFNCAIARWGYEHLRNPVVRGLRPKVSRGRERRLEEGEEARLIAEAVLYEAAAKLYSKGRRVQIAAAIRFALASCMRLGEIAEVRPSRINLAQSTILLPSSLTKNGRARTVALAPSGVRLLRGMMPTGPSDDAPLFGSASALGTAFKRIRDRAGLVDFRFHDLRHEAISRLFELTDLSESEIATISGHQTAQMLRRYTHLRAGHIVEKLARAEARRSQIPQEITAGNAA
jgi:integrase